MKITNWILLIAIVIGMLFLGRYIGAKETTVQTNNHDSLSDALSTSLYDAGLVSSWSIKDSASVTRFVAEFEKNIASSLGYNLTDEAQVTELRTRVPAIAIFGDTGFALVYTTLNRSAAGNEFVRIITPMYNFVKNYGRGYTAKISFSGYVYVTNSITGDSAEGQYDTVYIELGKPSQLYFMKDRKSYESEVRSTAAEMISRDFTNIVHEHTYGKDSNDRYTFEVPFAETYTAREITAQTAIAMYQGATAYVTDGTVNIYSFAAAELQTAHKYVVTDDLYYHQDGVACTGLAGHAVMMTGTKEECAQYGAYACPRCFIGAQ